MSDKEIIISILEFLKMKEGYFVIETESWKLLSDTTKIRIKHKLENYILAYPSVHNNWAFQITSHGINILGHTNRLNLDGHLKLVWRIIYWICNKENAILLSALISAIGVIVHFLPRVIQYLLSCKWL